MHPLLNIAIKAARSAGKIIIKSLDNLDNIKVDEKGLKDFVTEVDKLAEQEIIQTVRDVYRDHSFLAEESGESGKSDFLWIIDPLDGTTNFIKGIPCFAVSIAVKYDNKLQHAVIYDPMTGEMFTASRGVGAYFNNRRIRIGKNTSLDGSIIGLGYPYRNPEFLKLNLDIVKSIFPSVIGIRVLGSAALTLAYVAAGRLDGALWVSGLGAWDVAAGILLIQEAGGAVSDFNGGEEYSSNMVAGNLKILKSLLKIVKSVNQ